MSNTFTMDVPAGHVVLAVGPWSYHVPSDNAMIDSGTGMYVETWDGEIIHTHTFALGRPGPQFIPPAINASDEQRQEANAYLAADDYIKDIVGKADSAFEMKHGSQVKVVKGRKVPKGEGYEVVSNGVVSGDYGPYVNLRDKGGKFYGYISVGNLEVVPDFARVIYSPHAPLNQMMIELMQCDRTEFAWGLIADYIDDVQYTGKDNLDQWERFSPHQFVAAFRRLVKSQLGKVKPSVWMETKNNGRRIGY